MPRSTKKPQKQVVLELVTELGRHVSPRELEAELGSRGLQVKSAGAFLSMLAREKKLTKSIHTQEGEKRVRYGPLDLPGVKHATQEKWSRERLTPGTAAPSQASFARPTLVKVPRRSINPHPRNPRLGMHADVIAGIAAQLSAAVERGDPEPFGQEYAVHARRLAEDRFELLSGHHQLRAAEDADLKEVYAWVFEGMSDEEAYMRLALANSHTPLTQLELGLHALGVAKGTGGRGKKGGLTEYAAEVGKGTSYVSEARAAAEVFASVKLAHETLRPSEEFQDSDYREKAAHLLSLRFAPLPSWRLLAERMIAQQWSAGVTKTWAIKVRDQGVEVLDRLEEDRGEEDEDCTLGEEMNELGAEVIPFPEPPVSGLADPDGAEPQRVASRTSRRHALVQAGAAEEDDEGTANPYRSSTPADPEAEPTASNPGELLTEMFDLAASAIRRVLEDDPTLAALGESLTPDERDRLVASRHRLEDALARLQIPPQS